MTPEFIRKHSSKMFDDMKTGLEIKGDPVGVQISVGVQIFQALWEIAAQLGELNERNRSGEKIDG